MNVFHEKSYRSAIEKLVVSRKHLDSRMRFSLLADHMRVQKSYLSKVLGGKAHLNADQLHLACQYLGLNEEESRYLQMTLEHERSVLTERKLELEREMEKARGSQLESEKHLKARPIDR
ncbi:MAG: hypothetical protein EBZ48_17105, partial [Proteobacteria bacterium]|nr:hypothetical protein [Pseudomonadota bacterium]